MKKYIVYGQPFETGTAVEIAEYDRKDRATERLGRVRRNAEYEYEWIQEVEIQ